MACTNKSLPEYQDIKSAFNGNELLTDVVIAYHQRTQNTEEYPSQDEALDILEMISDVPVNEAIKERFDSYKEKASTQVQKTMISALAKHEDRTEFDEASHTYVDKDSGAVLSSTTSLISGEFTGEDNKANVLSREAGNYVDKMLDQILQGVPLENMDLKILNEKGESVDLVISDKLKQSLYADLQERVRDFTQNGEVLIPQFRVQNLEHNIAGSIDVLVVHKDGTVSILDLKTSKRSVINGSDALNYENAAYEPGKGSVFHGRQPVIKLTKRQTHSLQVNSYGRMLEHAGFTVNSTSTISYKLNFNKDLDGLTGFAFENESSNRWSDDATYAEMVIPLSEGDQYRDKYSKAAKKKAKVVDDQADSLPTAEIIKKLAEGVIKPLRSRLGTLEMMREQRANIKDANVNIFVPKEDQTINTLAALIDLIEQDIREGKPLLGFGRFLNYAIENMEVTNDFLTSEDALLKESTAGILLNYERFLSSYEAISMSINSLNDVLPGEQRTLLNKFAKVHSISLEKYRLARKDYIKNILKTTSENLSDEEIERLYEQGQDIGKAASSVDLDTSSDIFLRLIAKNFKQKLSFAHIKAMDFNDRLDRESADLLKISRGSIDFTFMYEKTDENDYRVINPMSSEYYKERKRLKDQLRGPDGEMMQYRVIEDASKASEEDLEYNKQLFQKKQELYMFDRAEVLNDDGTIEDGEYHQYTKEFKETRARYEYHDGTKWNRRSGVPDEVWYGYRSKYFNNVEYVGAVRTKTGSFTGIAKKREGSFPKRKFVEPRQITGKGKDMRSDKYKKLMTDTTEMGEARRRFYNFYIKEYEQGGLGRLPNAVYNDLKYRFPTRDAINETIEKVPTGVLRTFSKIGSSLYNFATDWKLRVPENRQTSIAENGEVISQIPVLYGPGYVRSKNLEDIEKVETAIKELEEKFKKGGMSFDTYNKEKDVLRVRLTRLNARPNSVAPVSDLIGAMKSMYAGIEVYEKKLALEDSFNLMRNQVNNRQYLKGESVVEGQSMVSRRLDDWMKQIYRAEDYTVNFNRAQRFGTVVARKLKSAVSLKSVGLNPISWTANAAWGQVSDHIEAAGGRFFNLRNLYSARKEYYSEYLPGVVKKFSKMNGKLEIPDTLPNSKYEAVVRRLDMVRNLLDQGDRGNSSGIPFEYKGIDIAEYGVQSITGIAVLKKIQVRKENQDGDLIAEKSLYDIFNFNEKDSSLDIEEGWKIVKDYADNTGELVDITDQELGNIRNYIFEINKQLHGNYAEEDKVPLQHSVLGDLTFQFHKWIIPSIKTHWRSRYFDENLGYYEGRYISFINFLGATVNYSFNVKKAWENADDMERANIIKTVTQLGFIMSMFLMTRMLLEFYDDDDERDNDDSSQTLNAILVLLDTLQGDASYLLDPSEIIRSAKNPIPVIKYAEGIGEAAWATMAGSYYALTDSDPELRNNKSVYYQRGSRKGKLKMAKEWRDVLPILSVINRWKGFETVRTNYYE